MAQYGGAHTNFSDSGLVWATLGGGVALGSALLQGVQNYQDACAEAEASNWSDWDLATTRSALDLSEALRRNTVSENIRLRQQVSELTLELSRSAVSPRVAMARSMLRR